MNKGHAVSLRVVDQTSRWVVVDKPSGLLSVPGRGPEKADCVAARVAAMFPDASGPLTVHRLDMETSGLMVLALDAEAHRALSGQFETRQVAKRYEALLQGRPEGEAGEVTLALRLDVERRPRQVHDPEQGRPCLTRWRRLAAWRTGVAEFAHVEFEPVTGRSHQLRVHAAHPLGLGCPILGDTLYGDAGSSPRLMLHATRLCFNDPDSGERVVCVSTWQETGTGAVSSDG